MELYYSLIWNSLNDYKVNVSKEPILTMEYYICDVKLRKSNILLKIYGQIKHNSSSIIETDKDYKLINNIPFLKSNLQKAIRRGKTDIAIISAYNLIVKDFWAFIRRIIIISIEDVSFLDNTDFLVWCMLAYPNFEISNEITQYLLTTVYKLSKSKKALKIKKEDTINAVDFNDKIKFPLMIRGEYGGLKGDVKMINHFCNNPILKEQIINVPRKKIKISRGFYRSDIIYESIDFHISKKLIPYVKASTDYIDEEIIKKIIWYNNSSYNFRKKTKIYKTDDWNIIKPYVVSFQKKYVVK